jgi:DNA modification methylase
MSESPLKQNKVVMLDTLIPHPDNYRSHPDEQVQKLVLSLQRFGQGRSIVIQDSPGKQLIVAGHGIVEAAKALKWPEIRADILPADWTPEQIRGYLIADNQHSQGASDDEAILARLLQEQQDLGIDLASLGTDDETLRQMLESLGDEYLAGGEEGAGGDDYEVNPDEVEVRCKRGELWAMGKHRLLVDDSTKRENVEKLMQGEKAVCCWTDPPYGVSYVGKTKDALTLQNDGKEDIDAFLQRAFTATDTALEDGAAIYIAHPAGALSITFGLRFLAQGWRLHETLIWVKDSMVLGHSDYHYRHEPILFGYKQGEGRHGRGADGWYGDNSQTTVLEVPRPKASESHPTMKPIELIEIMLLNSSPKKGLVYDPFLGSGSTLIAGERSNRRVYGCELDTRYATVILNRWEVETNQTAQLLERSEEPVHA